MKKFTKYFVLAAVALCSLVACEKEEEKDEDKAYVGTWASTIYPSVSFQTEDVDGVPTIKFYPGTQIPMTDTNGVEQMVFTFTNTTFEDEIRRGATAESIVKQLTMLGDIADKGTTMDATITGLEVAGVKYSSTDVTFATLFQNALGGALNTEFEVTYEISNDTMYFTIPLNAPAPLGSVNTPLVLIKQ